MNIDKNSFILVSSILGLLTFSVIYQASLFLTPDKFLTTFCLILLVLFSLASFFAQPSDLSRVILLLGASLSLPMISIPLMTESNILGNLFQNITLDTDRIQIRNVPVIILSLLFFLKTLIQLSKSSPKAFSMALLILSLFVSLLFTHDYQGYSIFQSIIDFFYFLAAFSVFLFFRFIFPKEQVQYMYNSLFQVMFLFSLVILIDLAVSISGVFPWSWSYRDGLQGVLYGQEVTYSFILGTALIFLFSTVKNYFLKILLLISFSAIWLTNIDTALFAAFICLVLINKKTSMIFNGYTTAIFFLVAITLSALLIDPFQSEESSLWARAGTYYVTFNVLAEGSWVLGIMPGVVDFSMPSNLAQAIFNVGFSEYLTGLPEVIADELKMRGDYETGDPILPHNSALALFSSYGLLFFIPAFYYYYFLPFQTVIKTDNSSDKRIIVVGRILLFICLFSTFHPLITPILIVFFGELLRLDLLTQTYKYK